MANLVLCCDGTWNTPDQRARGVPDPSNVARLYGAVADLDADGTPQQKYYHPGVGTDGPLLDRLLAGGLGRGLDLNIMSAYGWLCDKFHPGDAIYLFGFSRGAYTVRSLCGLATYAGLLDTTALADAEKWKRIERVFQQGYRRKLEQPLLWRDLGWSFLAAGNGHIPIHFLGVWDTVGALGIPDDMALLNVIDRVHDYTFHDTNLSQSVLHARHAVALDEMRAAFQPTLWTGVNDRQDVRQLWFAGAHADVGGGYPETGLSDIALRWMADEARQAGLAFDPDILGQTRPTAQGVLHDSCSGAFALLPTLPRSAPQIGVDRAVHPSVVERRAVPPITQAPYRPTRSVGRQTPLSLDVFARQPWNETGIWLAEGQSYTFGAEGEWMDGGVRCGPDGCPDGDFQLGEVAQFAGTVLGKVETAFRQLTGNQSADFRFTRRHEDMRWFSLVGVIANGNGVDVKGHLQPHESFLIGAGCKYTPRRSGYLYAYANDAWNCYGNNRGSIELTVGMA